jgi:glutamyl-tRNA synthetase
MASLAPAPTSSYRGRLAPSPTGYLHVGHARTFFTAWQRARDAGGALVMRMEDLDPERSKSEYAQAALEDLRWLGIRWLEGPDKGGPFAPYVQSKRRAFHVEAWRRLFMRGHLFPCGCSRKDLETAAGAPHERAQPDQGSGKLDPLDDEPVYPGTCRHIDGSTTQLPVSLTGEPDVPAGINWRFRVPDGEAVEFVDARLGPQRFVAGVDFGDFLVWRRDGNPGSARPGLNGVSERWARGAGPGAGGLPSYQLACVVDDATMRITEVVRGADLLKSTARQILLNRALGFKNPAWYHCPLVVDHNGRRLAKRHDALSLRALRQRGLTPMNILSAELPVEV